MVDRSTAEVWDAHWGSVLSDEDELGSVALDVTALAPLPICRLMEMDLKSVLFAGNGISLIPYEVAKHGIEVTALDVSALASRFVQSGGINPLTGRGLRGDESGGGKNREMDDELCGTSDERTLLSAVQVVCCDVLNYEPAHRFGALYAIQLYQTLPEPARSVCVSRFATWLQPGGVLVISTHNASGAVLDSLREALKRNGFFIEYERTSEWFLHQARNEMKWYELRGEYFERLRQEEAAHAERLAAGAKMAILYIGSG